MNLMQFISAQEIDFDRVRDVLQGKRTGRGCGKTIAKLMLMISHAIQPKDKFDHKAFLFVAENTEHALVLQKIIISILDDVGFNVGFDYSSSHNQDGQSYGMHDCRIFTYFRGCDITFWFAGAGAYLPSLIRGNRFNRAFIDVTWDTAAKYSNEIDQVKFCVMP